jgi:hypothetical protein
MHKYKVYVEIEIIHSYPGYGIAFNLQIIETCV